MTTDARPSSPSLWQDRRFRTFWLGQTLSQLIAEKAQRMGMVLPTSPAVLDLRSGKVLGQPTPATGEDRLPSQPPPPVKPAALDPQPHVTVVQAPARTQRGDTSRADSSGRTGHAFRADSARAGRQGTTEHGTNPALRIHATASASCVRR